MFSRDVTAAMLVYLNNGTGIELYYHANVFFCFGGKTSFRDTEVAMETKPWNNFVEKIINKKSYELTRAFSDLWSLVMYLNFPNCTRGELSKHHPRP